MRFWLSAAVVSVLALPLAACDNGASVPSSGGSGPATVPQGCSQKQATAPNGYWVNGNTVCTPEGKPHLFHGVDRPSMKWSSAGQYFSLRDFKLMGDGNLPSDPDPATVAAKAWHANVVRIALNQDWWLQTDADGTVNPNYAPGYTALVDQVVKWAEESDLDVILDLHWSDMGSFAVKAGQQDMADLHSKLFWQQVATRFKDDGRVLFELYNEPRNVPQETWLGGGSWQSGGTSYTVVGMQQLYDAVRETGANNLVIVGGLDWAYDLSFVASMPVVGFNILYATHPYDNSSEREPGNWDAYWGYLTATKPVIVTEFGDVAGTGTSAACSPTWDETLIPYADKHNASWTAWAWWPGECTFPPLITDWNGTPNNPGTAVRNALLGYTNNPAALPASPLPPQPDAGTDAASGVGDGGVTLDSGIATDGGAAADSGAPADSGTPVDSGTTLDSGSASDAATGP